MKGKGNCILHLLVIHVQVACYKYHTCRNQIVQWQWPSKQISYRKFVTYTIDIYPHWLVIAFPVKSGQGPLWIIPWYTNFQGEKPIKGDQLVFATTPGGCTAKWFLFLQLMWHWCRAWFFCTNTTQLQSIWSPEISLHVLMGRMDWRTVCMRTLFNEDVVPLQMSIHFIVGWRRRTFFGNSKHQSNIVVQYPSQVAFQSAWFLNFSHGNRAALIQPGRYALVIAHHFHQLSFSAAKTNIPKQCRRSLSRGLASPKWYLHYFQDLNLPSNNHVFGAQKERKRQAWLPFLHFGSAMTCCLSGALMSPSYSTPTPHLLRPPMRLNPEGSAKLPFSSAWHWNFGEWHCQAPVVLIFSPNGCLPGQANPPVQAAAATFRSAETALVRWFLSCPTTKDKFGAFPTIL